MKKTIKVAVIVFFGPALLVGGVAALIASGVVAGFVRADQLLNDALEWVFEN